MKELIHQLTHENVNDIFVSGYIDSSDPAHFHPLYERLFFIMTESIYEVKIVDGVIHFNKINKINVWFDIEDDDTFSIMSLYSQIFKTEQQVKILQIDYAGIPFSKMSVTYSDSKREMVFKLNPLNFFGFTIES